MRGARVCRPGPVFGTLVVSDIVAAHDDFVRRGIDVSDMWHGAPVPSGSADPGSSPPARGLRTFFALNDPDGNAWIVQEVTTRRPGRT